MGTSTRFEKSDAEYPNADVTARPKLTRLSSLRG
ncbi:Uncharacterised protein [Vibrio cholerae]|nr:Uncharacterised protein [Vibrio cholerae]